MKFKILFLVLIPIFGFTQTSNPNLNRDLNAMKSAFLKKDFDTFVNYIYPKTFDLAGGKSNTLMMLKMMYSKIGNEISVEKIDYKNPGKAIKYHNEIQIALDEEMVFKTQKGNLNNQNTLIAISNNNGKNWTFLNTLNQSKNDLIKKFPNLSPQLELKSKAINKKQ